jgi:hypothetical protein
MPAGWTPCLSRATTTPADDHRRRLRTKDGREFPVEALLQSVPWNGGNALLLALKADAEPHTDSIAAAPEPTKPAISTCGFRRCAPSSIRRPTASSSSTMKAQSAPSAGRRKRLFGFRQFRAGRQTVRVAVCGGKPARGARLSWRAVGQRGGQRVERRPRSDRPRGARGVSFRCS